VVGRQICCFEDFVKKKIVDFGGLGRGDNIIVPQELTRMGAPFTIDEC
jgi:hypothetical protein